MDRVDRGIVHKRMPRLMLANSTRVGRTAALRRLVKRGTSSSDVPWIVRRGRSCRAGDRTGQTVAGQSLMPP